MSPTCNQLISNLAFRRRDPLPLCPFLSTSLLSAMVLLASGFVIEQGTFSQQNVRLGDKDWAGTDRDFADRI